MFGGHRSSSLVKSPGPAGPAPNARSTRAGLRLHHPGRAQHAAPPARRSQPNLPLSARSDAPSPPIKGTPQLVPPLLSSAASRSVSSPSPGRPALKPSFFLGPSHDAPQLSSQGVHAKRVLKFALSLR
ncbi:hypothetical protein NDU88_001406 [Pleurodeles waltl]|uniref:Uncharacterized protein n=1 Tax=Pleurodeles waltl TaxID=8319 RepID=A0AAV7KYI8_PLEWA|nr:hypothetical protein NDU88_001406 [Pleurodeles waltl]